MAPLIVELEEANKLPCDVRTCDQVARYLVVWLHNEVKLTCDACCERVSGQDWFAIANLFDEHAAGASLGR
jgi:hypothetical protein